MPDPITLREADYDEAAAPAPQDLERAETNAARASSLIAALLTGKYLWDRARLRYLNRERVQVSERRIAEELEAVRAGYRRRVELLGRSLELDGVRTLTVRAWGLSMRDELKALHATAAGVARGGFDELSAANLREIGRRTREQYQYLQNFAAEVLQGKQVFDGRFYLRSRMYVDASRKTFQEERRELMRESGRAYERNVLSPADHCAECVGLSDAGWVEIGTLPAPGDRECRSNCQCGLEYLTEAEYREAA